MDTDLIRPLLDALLAGRYVLVLALLVIVATGLIRKVGAATSWVHTTWGGTLLALATSTATAITVTMASADVVLTATLLWSCLMVGVSVAGGYVVIKNLLVDPILRPLALKAPAWAQPIFMVIFYIFDKPNPVVDVLNAGGVALIAVPGEGVTVITGAKAEVADVAVITGDKTEVTKADVPIGGKPKKVRRPR